MNPQQGPRRSRTGGFSGDIVPKGYKTGQLQQFTPEQMDLFGSLFSQVGPESRTSRLAMGDEDLFNEIEAPAMRQFQAGLGGLASRFSAGSGAKSLGGRRSSAFQNQGTAALSNFAQELQSNRQNLSRQAMRDLMEMSNQLLNQRPYERYLTEKPPEKEGFNWQGLAGGVVGGAGGFLAGGPVGAVSGAKLGYDIGTGFHSGDSSKGIESAGRAAYGAYGSGGGGYQPTGNEWR